MKTTIKKLYIVLDHPVRPHELHKFRSAFKDLGRIVYNRDEENKTIQGYPLVQFRVHEGKGAVFAINEGATAIRKWIADRSIPLVGPEVYHDVILEKLPQKDIRFYRLFHWIPMDERYFHDAVTPPLHSTNGHAEETEIFEGISKGDLVITLPQVKIKTLSTDVSKTPAWNHMFMTDKVKALEQILVNNIIEFAQACNWRISTNRSLHVRLHEIHSVKKVNLYGDQVFAFDITYAANVNLPDHLGLGRGKSLGYGWQLQSRHQDDLQKNLSALFRKG